MLNIWHWILCGAGKQQARTTDVSYVMHTALRSFGDVLLRRTREKVATLNHEVTIKYLNTVSFQFQFTYYVWIFLYILRCYNFYSMLNM